MSGMAIWQEPRAFVELDPIPDARAALHAGNVALLSAAGDDELAAVRLSPAAIVEAIGSADFVTAAGRDRLRRIWEAGRARDFGWTAELAPMVTRLPAPWLAVVQHVWCLWNDHIAEESLLLGRVGTRLDTMLELTGAPFTASQAASHHSSLASDIVEGKTTAFESWALRIAGNPVTVFAADYVSFGIGGIALSQLTSRLHRHVYTADDWILDLALRYALSDLLQRAHPPRFEQVRQNLFTEAQQLGTSTDHTRRVRMLLAAYRTMTGETPSAQPCAPTFTGMRVNDALAVAAALDVPVTLIDPADEGRRMVDKSRWVVVAQHPEPGTVLREPQLRLAYGRPGERVREWQVRALSAAEPPPSGTPALMPPSLIPSAVPPTAPHPPAFRPPPPGPQPGQQAGQQAGQPPGQHPRPGPPGSVATPPRRPS